MEQTLDLRIQKTYLSLTKTLLEMMEEMPFEEIKVKELCDRAMIRKSTFYKHFADKYELLTFLVKEVIEEYNLRLEKEDADETAAPFYEKITEYVFDFVKTNRKLIQSAIRSDSLTLLLNLLSQQVTPDICHKLKQEEARGHRLPASPEILAAFFVGGVSENIRNWFSNDQKISEEDIKKQLGDIIRAVYQIENTAYSETSGK